MALLCCNHSSSSPPGALPGLSSKLEAVKMTATAIALRSTNASLAAKTALPGAWLAQIAGFDNESTEQGTYETGRTHPGAFTEPTALSALSATLLTASAKM